MFVSFFPYKKKLDEDVYTYYLSLYYLRVIKKKKKKMMMKYYSFVQTCAIRVLRVLGQISIIGAYLCVGRARREDIYKGSYLKTWCLCRPL